MAYFFLMDLDHCSYISSLKMELSIKTGKHKSMRREDSEQAQGAHASCYKVRAPRTKIIKQPRGALPYVEGTAWPWSATKI